MQQLAKKIFKDFDIFLSGAFLTVTVLVVIVNVLLRYLFQGGLFWVEEVATTSFIWSVFIGSAAAYRKQMHIGIDLITRLFPKSWQEILGAIVTLLMVIINGYICYLSVLFIRSNGLKRTPVLDVPAMYVNSALTVSFGLITIYALLTLFKEIRMLSAKSQK